MTNKANRGAVTAEELAAVQDKIDRLAARAGIRLKRNPKTAKAGREVTGMVAEKDSVTHDSTISFRIPSKWKANIEKQLEGMGLPKRQHSEFYRGAVIASLGTAMRAKGSAWQAFLEAAQPLAQQKLGTKLTDEGLAGILRQGTILPGTPD